MKKFNSFLAFFLLINLGFAQAPLQHRGMYVDGFIKFRDGDVNPATLLVDPNRSILGVDVDGD